MKNKETNSILNILEVYKGINDFDKFLLDNDLKIFIKKQDLLKSFESEKKDIISELYDRNLLSAKNLQFIIRKSNNKIKISNNFIETLIKEENIALLDVIIENYYTFYKEAFVLELCFFYKNKTPISDKDLEIKTYNNIQQDKKIPTENLAEKNSNQNIGKYLYNACKQGKEYFVKLLIELGADVNKEAYININAEGGKTIYTPLITACREGYKTIVKYLVKHGANVNMGGSYYSPYIAAVECGRDAIANFLVEHGAKRKKRMFLMDSNVFMAADKIAHEYRYKKNRELVIGCENERIQDIEYLIKYGANVNTNAVWEKTPLIEACSKGNLDIVKYLIEHGADVNLGIPDINENITPLIVACEKGHETVVKYLVEKGAYLDLRPPDYVPNIDINFDFDVDHHDVTTPLIVACEMGHESIVKFLVEQGADVNINVKLPDSNETKAPLITACEKGNLKLVKYFVQHGANVHKINKKGDNLLFIAYHSKNGKVLKYLIEECRMDVNKVNKNGDTLLIIACETGNIKLVRFLVEHGAKINEITTTDGKCKSPLIIALKKGYISIVKYLIENGVDVNKVNNENDSLLFIAYRNKNEKLLKYLIEKCGVDVNKVNKEGDTLLVNACIKGNENLVKYLVEHGADINKKGKNGKVSPISAARYHKNYKIEKYLIKYSTKSLN